ncbi:MAG: glycosyltransferase family 4 protein [Pseudomonadota bacterium]
MLKILHIFSTFAVGGPQRRLAQLVNNLEGYAHTISAMDGRYDAQTILKNRYAIKPVEITKNSAFDLGNISRLRALIREVEPNLVCTYNWGSIEAVAALWAERRFGGRWPHLHFEDGFGPEETVDRQIGRRVWARKLLLRGASVIAPSKTLWESATTTWSLKAQNVAYVPNGIDVVRFQPAAPFKSGPLTVGAVGALRPEKNFARLIEAFIAADLPNAQLHIAGEGGEREALEALIKTHGAEGAVRLIGHLEDPARFYQDCDIFALSSDTEQMPLTVLEAMACGLPVVATDVGDIREMVADENAPFVVSLNEADALTAAMQKLAAEKATRCRLGALNREKVETAFSQEVMLARYDQMFRRMAAER